jgi:hypothetical protein
MDKQKPALPKKREAGFFNERCVRDFLARGREVVFLSLWTSDARSLWKRRSV